MSSVTSATEPSFEARLSALNEDMIGTTTLFECASACRVSSSSPLNENDATRAMFLVLDFQLECVAAFCSNELKIYSDLVPAFASMLSEAHQGRFHNRRFSNRFLAFGSRKVHEIELHVASFKVFLEGYTSGWQSLIQGVPDQDGEALTQRYSRPADVKMAFLGLVKSQNNPVGTATRANIRRLADKSSTDLLLEFWNDRVRESDDRRREADALVARMQVDFRRTQEAFRLAEDQLRRDQEQIRRGQEQIRRLMRETMPDTIIRSLDG